MIEVNEICELARIIKEENKVIIIDFWAKWCQPCLSFIPKLETLEKFYKGKVLVVKINIDEADSEIVNKFNISSIPSIHFINQRTYLRDQTITGADIGSVYANTDLILKKFNP